MSSIALLTEEQLDRCERRRVSDCAPIWDLLDQVTDPEIPVVSIWDLGVLQDVFVSKSSVEHTGRDEVDLVNVLITPTYSGCPAMDAIEQDIKSCLLTAGYANVSVRRQLAPVWSTDWMSERARQQLHSYGIAPPLPRSAANSSSSAASPNCPQCGASEVSIISEFGSTACKALYRCTACLEPFDYFKCL